ncbi:MAG: hypothetical protein ACLP53_17310 [Isosphaeraceae bacterium]
MSEADCIGELPDLLRRFAPRHGLGIARAGFEDHVPEPHRFAAVAALFGQGGEVAQGEVAVDALIDATERNRPTTTLFVKRTT